MRAIVVSSTPPFLSLSLSGDFLQTGHHHQFSDKHKTMSFKEQKQKAWGSDLIIVLSLGVGVRSSPRTHLDRSCNSEALGSENGWSKSSRHERKGRNGEGSVTTPTSSSNSPPARNASQEDAGTLQPGFNRKEPPTRQAVVNSVMKFKHKLCYFLINYRTV